MRLPAALACAVLLLASSRLDGQAAWSLVRSGTLTVVGDQPPARMREIATRLDTFRLVVGQLIRNARRPPAMPTVALVVGTRRAMQAYLPPAMAGAATGVAGYFRQDPDVNRLVISLEGLDDSMAVAYHEYTHLLLRQTLSSPPPWLEEGIAVYYSTYAPAPDGEGATIGQPRGDYVALLRRQWMPVSDLIRFSGTAATAHDNLTANVFYGEASLLVHYLLAQPGGGDTINTYLGLLAEERDPGDAFFEAFGTSPASMDEILQAYVRRGAFQARRIPLPGTGTASPPAAALMLTAAETAAWQGEALRSVGHADAAGQIEAAALDEPESGITQLMLGRARLAGDDAVEGRRVLAGAAARAPNDYLTQFWTGLLLLRSGATPEELPVAASALRRAAALEPDSAEAHGLLAAVLLEGRGPVAEARAAIERALRLMPDRLTYRMIQAETLVAERDLEGARALLRVLVRAEREPLVARRAQYVLGRLDAERESQVTSDGSTYTLRRLRRGEARERGLLTQFECRFGEVRFHVEVGGRAIVATARSLAEVQTAALGLPDMTLACGPRTPPDHLFLTWRPDSGTAVAVEFVPAGARNP